MKKITLLFTLALASYVSIAQERDYTDSEHVCGTSQATNQIFTVNPEFAIQDSIKQVAFQIEYENYLESWSPDERSLYVVPVVVHIVHLGGSENISDEQVHNAIENLNADFNEINSDLGSTVSAFSGITGNCNIEFRLATKSPSGECHSGITRTFSSTTNDTGISDGGHPIVLAVRSEHGNWPQNKYMNIFVCMDPNGNAGYTFRPSSWYSSSGMYGSIYMSHSYMGTIGTSSIGRRHTLSHEVGHWLNLSHPWGNSNSPGSDSNCGTDDGVDDTPNTKGWNNCSNVLGETCGSLDNVQNIMDYSYCSTMFTDGQAARVQTALLGTTAQRYKLSAISNLVATGTDGPGDLCKAQFSSNTRSICVGETVNFNDISYHTVTSREWIFEGGSPSSSTSASPSITYSTPGVYAVTLNVSNGGDSESESYENYIFVMPSTGIEIPYKEGFEIISALPDYDRFTVYNAAEDVAWTITSSAASIGSKSAVLNNHGITNKSKDAIVSATIDLSSVDSEDDIIFNFKYAYKKINADNDEWIRFYISKDCGETWALRKNIHGSSLSSDVTGSPYTPSSPAEWNQIDITNIFADYYVSGFRYKIEFQNDNGNNLYIDDINLYPASMTNLVENSTEIGINVYPNPVENKTEIELIVDKNKVYTVDVYNALGEKITTLFNGTLNTGKNTIQWSTDNLAKGIYILRVESQDQIKTIKVVKN